MFGKTFRNDKISNIINIKVVLLKKICICMIKFITF